jgi:FemAB-related protein (PEP-CTERM system-associated)
MSLMVKRIIDCNLPIKPRERPNMRVQLLTEELDHKWDSFVLNHPESTCYHLRAWKNAAERGYGLSARFLLAMGERGRVLGVLPLFRVNGIVKAHYTNGLFGAYAPIIADSKEASELLLESAFNSLHDEGLPHLILKTLADADVPRMRRLDSWVIATLPLDPDPDKNWASQRRKIRNCVGKAQREGVTVHWGADQLEDFYDVLAENMHSKGTPIYGLSFIRELFRSSGSCADILVLRQQERAVAGALVMMHRGTISVPFASSRPGDRSLRPSNLLVWEIMKHGCLKGMTMLDFGRSLRGSTALDFKLGWGAKTFPQPVHVLSTRGKDIKLDPGEVKWFVNTWKRLPRPLVDRVGPLICRQIAGLL